MFLQLLIIYIRLYNQLIKYKIQYFENFIFSFYSELINFYHISKYICFQNQLFLEYLENLKIINLIHFQKGMDYRIKFI